VLDYEHAGLKKAIKLQTDSLIGGLEMVELNEVWKMLVYEESHKYYGLHSHIVTDPVVRADLLFRSIVGALEKSIPRDRVSVKEGEIDVYSKRDKMGYRRRFLRITYISGETEHHRIHIHFEHRWGRRYFFQALKKLFPNAEIQEEVIIPERKRTRTVQKAVLE
jgi:hypothetical protein